MKFFTSTMVVSQATTCQQINGGSVLLDFKMKCYQYNNVRSNHTKQNIPPNLYFQKIKLETIIFPQRNLKMFKILIND